MIYGECLFLFTWISGPYFISLISGGAGDWIAKVSDVGVPCLHDLTPNKNPRQQGLHELPWLPILHMCCHTSLMGELRPVHTTTLGEDN